MTDREEVDGLQARSYARDQAESLRIAIERARRLRARPYAPREALEALEANEALEGLGALEAAEERPKAARVFAVASGKGGVGKTCIAANLAIALSEMGQRTAIIDADMGVTSIESLYGVRPQAKLADIIASDRLVGASFKDSFKDALKYAFGDGPRGVKFISCGTGIDEIARAEGEQAAAFASGLAAIDLDFDVVIVDTSAGIADSAIGLSLAADEVLLVTTPEPTSVTDAYALIKSLAQRERDKPIRLVVNRAQAHAEAMDVLSKLARVADRFLDLQLEKLGYIQNDLLIVRSAKEQRPFVIGFPDSGPSQSVREIATLLMERRAFGDEPSGRGLAGFFASVSRLMHVQYK